MLNASLFEGLATLLLMLLVVAHEEWGNPEHADYLKVGAFLRGAVAGSLTLFVVYLGCAALFGALSRTTATALTCLGTMAWGACIRMYAMRSWRRFCDSHGPHDMLAAYRDYHASRGGQHAAFWSAATLILVALLTSDVNLY